MAKIMLVEDDNNLREIYGARLMAEGYQIVSAADGEEALALAVKEKPDLIISDVMMPKISGFDMLDILRTTPETKSTKVIMMTALSQPEDRARGESLGADKYLVKSQVTLEDVVVAVHEILGDGPTGTPSSSTPVTSVSPTPTPPTVPAPTPTPSPSVSTPTEPVNPQVTPTTDDAMLNAFTPQPPAVTPTAEPTISVPTPPENVVDDSPPNEDQLPKVEGASDAPEPASRKKKIIAPINDLSQDNDRLMSLVAEEAKKDAALNALSSVDSVNADKPLLNAKDAELSQFEEITQALEAATTDSKTAVTKIPVSSQTPENNQHLAAEKAALMDQVESFVNSGAIDAEATSPPAALSPFDMPQIDKSFKNTDPVTNEAPITDDESGEIEASDTAATNNVNTSEPSSVETQTEENSQFATKPDLAPANMELPDTDLGVPSVAAPAEKATDNGLTPENVDYDETEAARILAEAKEHEEITDDSSSETPSGTSKTHSADDSQIESAPSNKRTVDTEAIDPPITVDDESEPTQTTDQLPDDSSSMSAEYQPPPSSEPEVPLPTPEEPSVVDEEQPVEQVSNSLDTTADTKQGDTETQDREPSRSKTQVSFDPNDIAL